MLCSASPAARPSRRKSNPPIFQICSKALLRPSAVNLPLMPKSRRLIAPCYRPTKLRMFLKHLCGIDDRLGHDRCQTRMLVAEESLKSIEIGKRVHRPFELHRSCHDLNAGDPHVRSHRTTAPFEMIGSPASIAAQRRSSSASSSVDSASCE